MIEGNFIIIEGIDGAGTSTQAERLAAWYRSRGLPVRVTHEPTAGPIGSLIHQVLTNRIVVCGMTGPHAPNWTTMALLFAADRLDHLEAEILPNLRDGVTVISDRYDLSSLAYQSQTSSDPEAVTSWVRELNRHARRPDLTLVLDVDPDVAARRREARAANTELYEEDELQRHLAAAYRDAERLVPGDFLVHLDGNRAVDVIEADVIAEVKRLRKEKR
jgi:dTMP kinase